MTIIFNRENENERIMCVWKNVNDCIMTVKRTMYIYILNASVSWNRSVISLSKDLNCTAYSHLTPNQYTTSILATARHMRYKVIDFTEIASSLHLAFLFHD